MGSPRIALMMIAVFATSPADAARADETTGSIRGTLALAGHPLPRAKAFLHPNDGKAISTKPPRLRGISSSSGREWWTTEREAPDHGASRSPPLAGRNDRCKASQLSYGRVPSSR